MIAEPLSRLTKKNQPFVWSEEAQDSFERLKRAMMEAATLAYPFPEIPCILDTDASDVAVGAVLSQVINGEEKPIAFFLQVLGPTQKNYCPTRRELLAVVSTLQHFRHYLLGNKVVLRTDHHSLKWLKTFKRPEDILARWIKTIAEFDYTIEHCPGRLHSNAVEPLSVHALWLLPKLTLSKTAMLKAEDTEIGAAYQVLFDNTDPSPDELRALPLENRMLLANRPVITIKDEVTVRHTEGHTQLVVPTSICRRLFDLSHAGPAAAHLGAVCMIDQLKQHFSGLD